MTFRSLARQGVVIVAVTLAMVGFLALGYAGMTRSGRLGALGAALVAGTVMYAVARVDGDDRLTSGLFASGYSLIALTGAAVSVSVEAAVPFLVALLAWYLIDMKRREDLDASERDEQASETVESEVSL
jgi:hypothetical protein